MMAAAMVDMSALEARQTSPTLYNEEDLQSRLSRPEEDMVKHHHIHHQQEHHRYYLHHQQQQQPDGSSSVSSPGIVMSRKHSRRKLRDVKRDALQELDDTVASIGSRRGDTSWNDGDSVSQSSQTIATHEGHSTTHRSLIANMRDIKDMRGRSLPNPYVVGPRSVSSRRSRGSSRTGRMSRRSSSLNRKQDALERMVSLTLLETATSEDAESHFLSIAEDSTYGSVVTTEDILHDLITVSTIVDQERSFRDSTSSPLSHVPKNPKPLLPNVSGDSGEASSYDNVDYDAPRTVTPIFFKIQKQAAQTIPEEDSPRNLRHRQHQHQHSSPNQSISSPTDPFTHLETRETQSSSLWSAVERPRQASPAPSPPRRRVAKDPPAPKQLFEPPPDLTHDEDGFPSTPRTTEDTPVGAAVTSFFQSQMEAPSGFSSEWNQSDWTTFETSPFEASDASPSSVVVDSFHHHHGAPMIGRTASVDSGCGSKYSI